MPEPEPEPFGHSFMPEGAPHYGEVIGGALITEIAFGWEGMGRFLLGGLTGPVSPDVYVVQAWLMVAATAVIAFNIIADLIYGLLDPRIRYA